METKKQTSPLLLPHAEDLLASVGKESNKTLASYRTSLINFQGFAWNKKLAPVNQPLATVSITESVLADYFTWLQQQKYSNATIRLYLTVAMQYMNWLEASHALAKNVNTAAMSFLLDKKIGGRKQRIKPARRGSDTAIGLLFGYYPKKLGELDRESSDYEAQQLICLRNHALLLTLYSTAGRAAEVAALDRHRIAEGNATQVKVLGKGKKQRMVILTDEAQKAIRDYLSERGDKHTGVFVSHGPRGNGGQLTTQSIWRIVHEASVEVFGTNARGKPKKTFGAHAFRHQRAQDLADEGMPMESIQAYLGHESIETTRSTYAPKTPTHVTEDQIATYGLTTEDLIKRAEKKKRATQKDEE